MTKRGLETDLEELSEELLGDLMPSERLQLALTARAVGCDDWLGQLNEACPRARHGQSEQAYTVRKRFAFMQAYRAVYKLRTTAQLFDHLETRLEIIRFLISEMELDSSEHPFEPVPKGAQAASFRNLYVYYEGYKRFADEELDVELEEWLAVHPDGPTTVAHVEAILDSNAGLREVAEAECTDGDEDEVSLDDFADQWAKGVRDDWNHVIDEIE